MAAAAASQWLRVATTAAFAVAWICALVAVLFQVLQGVAASECAGRA
jgi:hypothetical protein